jgi:hypothetical protein
MPRRCSDSDSGHDVCIRKIYPAKFLCKRNRRRRSSKALVEGREKRKSGDKQEEG